MKGRLDMVTGKFSTQLVNELAVVVDTIVGVL